MRAALSPIVLLAVACHGGSRPADSPRATRVATMDSATARRLCESPDSVIAGTKDCVLLDQGRRPQKFQPPPRAP